MQQAHGSTRKNTTPLPLSLETRHQQVQYSYRVFEMQQAHGSTRKNTTPLPLSLETRHQQILMVWRCVSPRRLGYKIFLYTPPDNLAVGVDKATQAVDVFLYYQIGEMLPPYLSECMHRIDQLENKNGRELLVSLWVLRNHATVMDPGKWRVFFEDYYKWYKATDRDARAALLRDTNLGLCGNWPHHIVPTNQRLETVYWSGWNPDQVEGATDIHNVTPFTMEDAYLAIYHRVVFVHGPEILQENISLKEFAFLMAYYFHKFLPRFIEEVFNFAQHPELTDMERTLLTEALLAYAKRRSSSWRHHLRNMYRAEQAPFLDI